MNCGMCTLKFVLHPSCNLQVYIGALKGPGDVWEWADGTPWNFHNFLTAEHGGLSNTCVRGVSLGVLSSCFLRCLHLLPCMEKAHDLPHVDRTYFFVANPDFPRSVLS
jgi:hypothetical protein